MKLFLAMCATSVALTCIMENPVAAQSRRRDQLHYRWVQLPDGSTQWMQVYGDPNANIVSVNVAGTGGVVAASTVTASGISLPMLLNGGQFLNGFLTNSQPAPSTNALNGKIEDLAFRLLERWIAKELGLPPASCEQNPNPAAPNPNPANPGVAPGNTPTTELDANASAASLTARAAAMGTLQQNLNVAAQQKAWAEHFQRQADAAAASHRTQVNQVYASAAAAGIKVAPRTRSRSVILSDIEKVTNEIEGLKKAFPAAAPAALPPKPAAAAGISAAKAEADSKAAEAMGEANATKGYADFIRGKIEKLGEAEDKKAEVAVLQALLQVFDGLSATKEKEAAAAKAAAANVK